MFKILLIDKLISNIVSKVVFKLSGVKLFNRVLTYQEVIKCGLINSYEYNNMVEIWLPWEYYNYLVVTELYYNNVFTYDHPYLLVENEEICKLRFVVKEI